LAVYLAGSASALAAEVPGKAPPGAGVPGEQPPAAPATKPAAPARPTTAPAAKPAAEATAKKTKEEENKPPEPEAVLLETEDPTGKWMIHCTYYAPKEGVRDGKITPPVIMLHGWGGQASEYSFLAVGLQIYGFAVIAPDLRGHGRSTTRKLIDGTIETVKFEDLKPLEIEGMVRDVESVKKYLRRRHNKGELNLDQLCVMGADVGSIIALNWAMMDWNATPTTWGRQGQDVKALILLSPDMTFKRINATDALKHPAISRQLSILIAAGENDRDSFREATQIYKRLENLRPNLVKDPDQLKKVTAPTALKGTKLLGRELPVNREILGFLIQRLVQRASDFPWTERVNPVTGKPYE
jgi:pimeloyl-ACP methyl ester carboxylesterase